MADQQDDLGTVLLRHAEKVIGRLLKQKDGRRDLSLTEMENLVGDLETDFRQTVMQALVDDSQVEDTGVCPACKGKVRHKGRKRKRVITLRGEVEVERAYYVCHRCETGFFPPG